ncbi:hypothetical protein CANMA_003325 [Candida margitis]|uniref:uncharacterized protein n=1 Tax=Candida margitis TaxID=1775924 RepID=UPI002225B973|nr:uncharacterized protein CANMA_003325 [Candida margitis]KAI5966079.1 hypothetical protein CANMA_003325 [Candida margitis]
MIEALVCPSVPDEYSELTNADFHEIIPFVNQKCDPFSTTPAIQTQSNVSTEATQTNVIDDDYLQMEGKIDVDYQIVTTVTTISTSTSSIQTPDIDHLFTSLNSITRAKPHYCHIENESLAHKLSTHLNKLHLAEERLTIGCRPETNQNGGKSSSIKKCTSNTPQVGNLNEYVPETTFGYKDDISSEPDNDYYTPGSSFVANLENSRQGKLQHSNTNQSGEEEDDDYVIEPRYNESYMLDPRSDVTEFPDNARCYDKRGLAEVDICNDNPNSFPESMNGGLETVDEEKRKEAYNLIEDVYELSQEDNYWANEAYNISKRERMNKR